MRGVEIIPHSTHRNKSDAEFGVETIAQHYQFGRVRLPYKRDSQGVVPVPELIDEVTQLSAWPYRRHVMAHWFFEWNLPRIYTPDEAEGKSWRPEWMSTVPDLRKQSRSRIPCHRHDDRSLQVIDAETIVSLYHSRRQKRQPMMDKRLKVLEQYNGETHGRPARAGHAAEAVHRQPAGPGPGPVRPAHRLHPPQHRLPVPPSGLSPCGTRRPGQSRMANLGWWDDEPDGPAGVQAGALPAGLRLRPGLHPPRPHPPQSDKRKIPYWQIRSPLNTFPAVCTDEMDCEPTDYIVAHDYPLSWLQMHYPAADVRALQGPQSSKVSRDMRFEVLEYNDADETVLVACGQTKDERQTGDWQDHDAGSAASVVLSRLPNRAGICNMVVPGRIVLDKPIGHFDTMLHLFTRARRRWQPTRNCPSGSPSSKSSG